MNRGKHNEITPSALTSRQRPCAGFTLIEMMVVLAVIGIVSALILPEMKGTYEDALLRSTSRKLLGAFDLASSCAVSQNLTCRVRLEPRAGRYLIEQRATDGIARGRFVPVSDLPGSEGELDTRISIGFHVSSDPSAEKLQEGGTSNSAEESTPTGAPIIGFYPDGTADNAELRLRDRDGFGLLLKINPVTARVHVIELGREQLATQPEGAIE